MKKAIAFRRILCPINFDPGSQRMVEGAAALAAKHGAELRLFHVVREQARGRDAETLIGSLFALTRTLPERTRVSAAISFGDPAMEIVQHARLMRADLIVLGTNRQSPTADVIRTIAAEVATHAGCPVLFARPHLLPSLSGTAGGYTDIVCCVDDASGAIRRGDYARALACDAAARVTLVNVVDADADEETSEPARATAEDVARTRHAVQISLTGSPGPEIVALAQQIRADLIVIGAQDATSLQQRLGSTAAHVMVNAPCPVLIIPRVHRAIHTEFQPLQNEMMIAD
jgi:nucleotide-binding universal stress UspA family protein